MASCKHVLVERVSKQIRRYHGGLFAYNYPFTEANPDRVEAKPPDILSEITIYRETKMEEQTKPYERLVEQTNNDFEFKIRRAQAQVERAKALQQPWVEFSKKLLTLLNNNPTEAGLITDLYFYGPLWFQPEYSIHTEDEIKSETLCKLLLNLPEVKNFHKEFKPSGFSYTWRWIADFEIAGEGVIFVVRPCSPSEDCVPQEVVSESRTWVCGKETDHDNRT